MLCLVTELLHGRNKFLTCKSIDRLLYSSIIRTLGMFLHSRIKESSNFYISYGNSVWGTRTGRDKLELRHSGDSYRRTRYSIDTILNAQRAKRFWSRRNSSSNRRSKTHYGVLSWLLFLILTYCFINLLLLFSLFFENMRRQWVRELELCLHWGKPNFDRSISSKNSIFK